MLIIFMPSFAQKVAVDGYVYEQGTGNPVNKAIVTICNQKSNILYSGITSKEGKFQLLTKGEDLSLYTIKVSCMGYKPASCAIGNQKKLSNRARAKGFCIEGCLCKSRKDFSP